MVRPGRGSRRRRPRGRRRAGLTQAEAAARLGRDGPNEITGEKPLSVWQVALEQLRDPMNIMLVAVTG